MEGRKLITVSVFVIFLLSTQVAYAFDQNTTHPGLTQEIISFYNEKNKNNKITANNAQRLIDGSIQEDEPSVRSLRHFYDPARDIGINDNTKAIDWVTTGGGIYHNNFTWGDAISAYADGNMTEFYFALGHVLHLVEDMGVPEHTRNDQHMNGSPFEDWTRENKDRKTLAGLGNKLAGKTDSKKFEDIVSAMKYLANYSNGNFFSRDTIDNPVYKYKNPKLEEKENGYVYDIDNLSSDKHKVLVIDLDLNGNEIFVVRTKDDTTVLADYFDRLSAQIIPVGVGVIELAIEQGEKLKAERAKEKEERLRQAKIRSDELSYFYNDIQKTNFFVRYPAKAIYAFEKHIWNPSTEFIASSAKSTGRGIAIAASRVGESSTDSFNAGVFTGRTFAILGEIFVKEKASEVKQSTITFVQKVDTALAPYSKYVTTGLPADMPSIFSTQPSVVYQAPPTPSIAPIINPTTAIPPQSPNTPMLFIAGSSGAPTPPPVETVAPTTPEVTTPAPEPESATTTPEVVPETTPPAEEPPVIPPPPAEPPQIAFDISECTASLTSSTCLVPTGSLHARIISNVADGSEFSINIDDSVLATSTSKEIELSLTPGVHSIIASVSDIGSGSNVSASPFVVEYVDKPLVISEVAWGGTDDDFNGEWIELHNTTNHPIDLTNFKLDGVNDGTPNIGLSGTIAPNQYYLIENQTDASVPTIPADLIRDFGGVGVISQTNQKILKSNLAVNKIQKAPLGRMSAAILIDFSSLQDKGEQLVLSLHVEGLSDIVVDETPLKSTCSRWCFGSASFNNTTTMARNDFTLSGLDPSAWVENVFEQTSVAAQMTTEGAKFFGSPGSPDIVLR